VKLDAKVTHPARVVVPAQQAQLMAARPRPVDQMLNANQYKALDSVSALQNSRMELLTLVALLGQEVNKTNLFCLLQYKLFLVILKLNLHWNNLIIQGPFLS
jgi:hypothetical protein